MYLFLLLFFFKGNESQYSFSWRFPRCHKDFRSLIEIVGSDPVVSLTPQDPIPWSHWHRGIRSRCFKETMNLIKTFEFFTKIFKSDPVVSVRPLDPFPRSHWNRGNQSRSLNWDRWIQTLQRLSRFCRRIRCHIQNRISPWIRAPGGIVWWKKPSVENLVTLSL
jgi:hypothetical protein